VNCDILQQDAAYAPCSAARAILAVHRTPDSITGVSDTRTGIQG